MYIDIAVYISIVCFIKLTLSNGYKSRKFVSLIDAPYFKNAFAPGASIRRNTVHVWMERTGYAAICVPFGTIDSVQT